MTATTTQVEIQTPEGVALPLTIAGPLSRALALTLDFAITSAASTFIARILEAFNAISPDAAAAVGIISHFVISIGYALSLEWFWRGQTVGKRVLRLRVMDASGRRLRFEQVLIRNILRFADMLPVLYLVGGLFSLSTRLNQRLGDLAANTLVVKIPTSEIPDWNAMHRSRYNSLLAYDSAVSRLRREVTPEAAAIAVEALERRDQMEPAGRVLLYRELAAHFRSLSTFPEEALQPLSDEQYLRNVVEIVAGAR